MDLKIKDKVVEALGGDAERWQLAQSLDALVKMPLLDQHRFHVTRIVRCLCEQPPKDDMEP